MKTKEKDIDLIENFLSGKLSNAEMMNFETRVEEDHEFARKLRLRKAFPSLFNAAGEDEINQQVPDISEVIKSKTKEKLLKTRYIVWSIIIVLIAVTLVYFIIIRSNRSGQEITGHEPSVKNVEQTFNQKPVALTMTPALSETQLVETKVLHETKPAVHRSVELITPADSMVINRGSEIFFRWRQETDSFTRICIVSDISDKIIWWRGIAPGIREYNIPANNFRPGKFFWYVGTSEVKRAIIIRE